MELLQVKTMLVGDSPFRLLLAALIAALVYGLARAAINVWLSPLSHVPGPRLAAARYVRSFETLTTRAHSGGSDLWGRFATYHCSSKLIARTGLWYQLQGTRYLKVHSLHEEVRVVERIATATS